MSKPQKHQARSSGQSRRGKQKNDRNQPTKSTVTIYGRHAVEAALSNPLRLPIRLLATKAAANELAQAHGLDVEIVEAKSLSAQLPEGTPHQGLLLTAKPLPAIDLEHWLEGHRDTKTLLALDQVSDPRNLGAILRSAAAFGVDAIIVPERHSAELNGACARAAAGALDMLPVIGVGNLARALTQCKDAGFWTVGLDANADQRLQDLTMPERTCLVLGAEDKGMRRLTAEHCDFVARLPIDGKMESLNVATAAAIALYELRR